MSEQSVTAMRTTQTPVLSFDNLSPNGWGLGWMVFDYPDGRFFGHDGGTIGQTAMMRAVPEHELAFAVLTNGGDAAVLMDEVCRRLTARFTQIRIAALPEPPQPPIEIDRRRFVGRYEATAEYLEVTTGPETDALRIESGLRGPLAEYFPDQKPTTTSYVGYDETTLIMAEADGGRHWRLAFGEPGADGRAPYVETGGRVALRVQQAEEEDDGTTQEM